MSTETSATALSADVAAPVDWRVTFRMRHGEQGRVFIFTVPATDDQAARVAAYKQVATVREASGGYWNRPENITAEVV